MKPRIEERGPRKETRTILRRHGVAIGPTRVDWDHLERIRIARRRLGLDEGVREDE